MHLVLLGMNHRTASLDEREALAFAPEEISALLGRMTRDGVIREAALISTCNRTEFYVVSEDAEGADAQLRAAVADARHADLLVPGPQRYTYRDGAAVRHLFRVATGLDSMVLGDVQILGQVKDAYVLARECGAVGVRLDRLFERALRAGKRARTETAIGAGIVSVASAATDLLRDELGAVAGRRLVIVGAGETGRLAARHLAKSHPADLALVNRSLAAADAVARELGGRARALPLSGLAQALAGADAVVCATRAPGAVITTDLMREVMATRAGRRLLLVDIAVPRDVEPAVASIPGVTLHAIDAIQQVVDTGLARRTAEVPRVEAILEQEIARYERWQRSLSATPVVRDLRDHFERVRAEEVQRVLRHAPAEERERAERLTRALINRLLHVPTLQLKEADPDSESGSSRLRAARELFALSGPESGV